MTKAPSNSRYVKVDQERRLRQHTSNFKFKIVQLFKTDYLGNVDYISVLKIVFRQGFDHSTTLFVRVNWVDKNFFDLFTSLVYDYVTIEICNHAAEKSDLVCYNHLAVISNLVVQKGQIWVTYSLPLAVCDHNDFDLLLYDLIYYVLHGCIFEIGYLHVWVKLLQFMLAVICSCLLLKFRVKYLSLW